MNFLWGVATSAYQIEGAPQNDWTAWEASGKLKPPGVPCGKGTGHRERWQSDLSLLPRHRAGRHAPSLHEQHRLRGTSLALDLDEAREVA
jgi:hypothetical protein